MQVCVLCCFFFNDTATTEIYTLSLHDALPISPYEEITKEEYSMFPRAKPINWESVVEDDDNTIGSQELACTGDKCEIL